MSKKTNTLFFILAATAFNILLTVAAFMALLLLFTFVIMPGLPESALAKAAAWAIPVIFIGAIAISFAVYRIILKVFMKKVNIEKHFDPIFGGRRRPVRRD
ncbi:MAG: leader peptide processing enzyme [Treponema sp.]|nr:leader peptide processing enzyme [Treponema sp.]